MARRTRPPRNGFTLVEVLVALVVTAFLLTIVMDGALTARGREHAAAQKRDAVMLARALLADASTGPWSEGERTGTEGALHWTVREAPAQLDPRHRFILAEIAVRIEDAKGVQLFDVSTRRLKGLSQ